jgi:hypothetical protein
MRNGGKNAIPVRGEGLVIALRDRETICVDDNVAIALELVLHDDGTKHDMSKIGA